MSFSWK